MKKEKSFFSDIILKILTLCFSAIFMYIFIGACFFNKNSLYTFRLPFNVFTFVIVTGLIYIFTDFIIKKENLIKFVVKRSDFVFIISILIVFFIQLIYSKQFYGKIGWDSGFITNFVLDSEEVSNINYFLKYPNNLLLFFFEKFLFNITNNTGIDFIRVLNIVNIIIIDISVFFMFKSVKLLLDVETAFMAYFISIPLILFSPWIVVFYSDTISMIFVTGLIFLFSSFYKSKNMGLKILLMFLMGMVSMWGYWIKPTVVIILIGSIIMIFLSPKEKFFNKLLFLALIIFGLLVSNILVGNYFKGKGVLEDKDKTFPFTHFLMMGLNTQTAASGRQSFGMYNGDDVAFTESFETFEEKKQNNIDVYKKRLSEYGVKGYLDFLNKKLIWISSDGTFFWGGEGNFIEGDLNSGTESEIFFKNLIYFSGNRYFITAYFLQAVWLFVILFSAMGIFGVNEKENRNLGIIRVCILGILMFILLFEGRSRYLFSFTPLFITMGAYGYRNVFNELG